VSTRLADFDAQAVYKELCTYALKSTKATINSSTMLTYITSSRLSDGTWKSGTHAYLLHWQDQVRKYEDIIPASDHFAPGQKRTMLENAVHSIADLRQVQIQAAHDKVRSGTAITYKQYVSLLLSAAQIHDSELGDTKPSKSRGQRQVYSHDMDTPITPRYAYSHNTIATRSNRQSHMHDIDTGAGYHDELQDWEHHEKNVAWEIYNANATYDRGPRLSKDQWFRLPKDAQGKWDELTPEAKHIILESKTRYQRPPPPRKANLHELTRSDLEGIDTYEFIQAHMHEFQSNQRTSDASSDITPDVPSSEPPSGDSKQLLLTHMTKRTTLPPGDLQRVLSSSINKSSTPGPSHAKDINISGKVLRQVNTANTIYVASDHRTVRRGALVDRGANGGIAGDDVRIIHESG
jgi:hypothetical protein